MSRGLWFAAGAGAGVYAMTRARRLAESLTADGLRDRAGSLALGARLLRDDVARGRAERETQLREQWGVPLHGRPELTGGFETLRDGAGAPPQDTALAERPPQPAGRAGAPPQDTALAGRPPQPAGGSNALAMDDEEIEP